MIGEQKTPPTHDEAVAKLGELIQNIKVAMMTTVSDEGHLRSRPMQSVQSDFDGDLWFFTSEKSGKVEEIQRDRQVNLSFVDPGANRYVSVSGIVNVTQDDDLLKKYWIPAFKAWFPDGLDDPNLALLHVKVEEAEYWDTPSSTFVHIAGFLKAVATHQPYQPGENAKLDLT